MGSMASTRCSIGVYAHDCSIAYRPSRTKVLADPARFELTTSAFGGQRSIQLSYGSTMAATIAEGPSWRNAA